MLFNYNNKFTQTEKQRADQGRKALFALRKNCKHNFFNIETEMSYMGLSQR
jgi:hypothetical protein